MKKQLAQINVAHLLHPIDHPAIAGFVEYSPVLNALAEQSPGFIWRLIEDEQPPDAINPLPSPLIVANVSVWESIEALKNYAYRTHHVQAFRKRLEWFHKPTEAHLALWWIEAGNYPTLTEAYERLEYLRKHGASEYAFDFKRVF